MSEWSLTALLRDACGPTLALPDSQVRVRAIAQHLDAVTPGTLFIARRGARVDAHELIPAALARGAVAVVGERPREVSWTLPYVQVTDARAALAALAASFYHHPSRTLQVAGITGTDGKTTSAALLHHLLQGDLETVRAGLLSTAVGRLGREALAPPSGFTTPEATEVQAFLARCRDAGARAAVVEASSHASALQRLAMVRFAVMGWTNLTPEHLDLHGTFEAYQEAKLALVRSAAVAVLNRDDPAFPTFAAAASAVIDVGFDAAASIRAVDVHERRTGWDFTLVRARERHPASLPMLGRYNLSNALVALAAAEVLGVPLALGVARLASFAGVPGRMEWVQREPYAVVVDFAHTPPALALVLEALRPAHGRLVVVIGAPGERDSAKRPELGALAVQRADHAIFTEDDTRSESLTAILAAITVGARAAGGRAGVDFQVLADRRAAIAAAIAWAQPGDVVLLAAKGHERTLKRSSGDIPWDEATEARAAIAARSMAS